MLGCGVRCVRVVAGGLARLVLAVVFAVADYVDGRAVATSDASGAHDALVWGLAALAAVVLSGFTLSFVLAI